MSVPFSIKVTDDKTRAEVHSLSPEATLEEVAGALRERKISCGIQLDSIAQAVHRAKATGQVQNGIIAAETPAPKSRVRLGKSREWLSGEDLEQLLNNLTRLNMVLKQEREMNDVPAGMFVSKGETCLVIDLGQETKNIYGEPLSVPNFHMNMDHSSALVKKTTVAGYELVAENNGYLVINETIALDIVDPIEISSDLLKIYFKFIPVAYGRESLSDSYFRTIGREASGVESCAVLHQDEIRKMLGESMYQKCVIKRGVAPVTGRNASLHLKVAIERDIIENSDGRVDYKNIRRFCEIEKGTLIAEKVKLMSPKPGINVLGQIIPVHEVRDVLFYPGENVTIKENAEAIRYFAGKTGVLTIGNDTVQITENLSIKGDVGLQTGNLRYSKDITISGNVGAGFQIECGGNLVVKGSVEDNVQIRCKGNLKIEKGLFGEKTKVMVGGDATIGFIQNSNVRVKGDLTVGDHIIQSNVFSNGSLVVEGRFFPSKERGCVVGGRVGSIKNIVAHSVGSSAALTTLCCGIDLDLYDRFLESKKFSVALKKRITDAQAKIGFSMQDKNILDKLKALSESRRVYVKQLLVKIRSDIALLTDMENKMAQLGQIAMATSCEGLTIEIEKNIFPEVFITMREYKKKITDRFSRAKVTVDKGEILCRQL